MSVESSNLIARLLAQRKAWVDVAPGKRIQVMRPPESALGELFAAGRSRLPEHVLPLVVKYTTGWDGFLESDLLGAEIGASDPVEFDPPLWEIVSADEPEWASKVFEKLQQLLVDRLEAKGSIAKN